MSEPIGVSAVVRLKRQVLTHPAGTIALVIGQAPEGRNRYEVMVPGDPYSFYPRAEHMEVVQGIDREGWWRRLRKVVSDATGG